jgi:hypothetical protein
LRLNFAVEPDTRVRRLAGQAVSVLAELGGVAVAGAIMSFATGWTFLTASGTVALVYYPVATAITGRVLSAVHLRSVLKVHPAGTTAPLDVSVASEPAPLYLISRQPAPTPSALPRVVGVGADEFPQPRTAAR